MAQKANSQESVDKLVKQLIQNNATLQSKSIDLISSVNKLTASTADLNKKIDSLLKVFETAAKHVSETKTTEDQISSLAIKLESLLEQNKNVKNTKKSSLYWNFEYIS